MVRVEIQDLDGQRRLRLVRENKHLTICMDEEPIVSIHNLGDEIAVYYWSATDKTRVDRC